MLSARSDPLRILLVDDDEDDYALTRDLVSQIRSPHRAELQWASGYGAGLQAMQQPWCEVCLLDYRLGARDGLELLAEARSSGCTCPIIVLTGKGNDDTDALAMRGGADDYICKGDLTVALLERSVRYAFERAHNLEALRASEQRYRSIFENSSDAILIAEIETQAIRYANAAAARLSGYSVNELCTMSVAELSPPDALQSNMAEFAAVVLGTKALAEGLPALRKDGVLLVLDVAAAPITIAGRPMIAGFFRDATARKRAEAEHARLAVAIEQADEAVVITDAKGIIEYVNPAFETGTGYLRAEVLGRNPRLLKSGVQDAAFYVALWATISAGKTWRGRMVNRKRDGTLYSEDATISPIRNAAGAVTSYVAVKRDVTDRLALDAQLLQAQKMEAVGRLAGGVAHDFNNVLSVVLTYAELVANELPPSSPPGPISKRSGGQASAPWISPDNSSPSVVSRCSR